MYKLILSMHHASDYASHHASAQQVRQTIKFFLVTTIFYSIYHKIKKKYYLCILYDVLLLWQRVRWGLNYPEN